MVFPVFKSAAEAGEKLSYDYVICAHKALNQDAAINDIKPLISPQTIIVIAQNGVGNEDPFRVRYPENSIISCAVSPQTTIFVRPEFTLYYRSGSEQINQALESLLPVTESIPIWGYFQIQK